MPALASFTVYMHYEYMYQVYNARQGHQTNCRRSLVQSHAGCPYRTGCHSLNTSLACYVPITYNRESAVTQARMTRGAFYSSVFVNT